MTWRLVEAKRVLQAGHWKSLKTSMTIGAFLEPRATCGSMSATGAEDWPARESSAGANKKARAATRLKSNKFIRRERSTQPSSATGLNRISYITRVRREILPRFEAKFLAAPRAWAGRPVAVLDRMRGGAF